METSVEITVLVENSCYKQGLIAEHGLSLLIECDGKSILFDTGQGNALPNNLCQLNLDPKDFDMLVISHNHYDHTGGLAYILEHALDDLDIFAHPECLNPCFSKRDENVRNIGLSDVAKERLKSHKGKIHWTVQPTQLSENVYVTGGIPRSSEFDLTDKFYSDKSATKLNSIDDDQTLYISTANGVVVVLGCAHSGVIQTLEYIKRSTNSELYAVIGGMHLIHATNKQRLEVAEYLKDNGVKIVAPLHCSGFKGRMVMANEFGDCYRDLTVGSQLIF